MTENGNSNATDDASARTCYIDESLRQTGRGLYVLAGVVIAEDALASTRSRLRAHLRPRQVRFHWRTASTASRHQMLSLLLESEVVALVTMCEGFAQHRSSRARAVCVKHLAWVAEHAGTRRLVFETREEHNDQSDRRVIVGEQRSRRLSSQLRYHFERPATDPMLWAADAIAGAVATREARESSEFNGPIGELVRLCERVQL